MAEVFKVKTVSPTQTGSGLFLESPNPPVSAINTSSGAPDAGKLVLTGANGKIDPSIVTGGSGGASSFDEITSGTNVTADMIVGSGGQLVTTGTGVIAATSVGGVTVTGVPTVGQIIRATSPTAADWESLGQIITLDCNSSTGLVGGLDCGSS